MGNRELAQVDNSHWLNLDYFQGAVTAAILEMGIDAKLVTLSRIEKLYRFSCEVGLWNRRMNLVGQFDESFLSLHLYDSLGALPRLMELGVSSGADVGSGAGLPGVVLALFMEDVHWTLIERSGKRAGFLRNVVALLGLAKQVSVLEADLAEVKEQYDLVVFRAFRSFEEFFPLLRRRLTVGGCLAAYKGKQATVLDEIQQVGIDAKNIRLTLLKIPSLEGERCLLEYWN